MTIWYLSFAGEEGWRGAVVLEADTLNEAITLSHRNGINPGGDVKSFEIPLDHPLVEQFPDECRNRLLTKEDLEKFWGPVQDVRM